MMQEGHTPSRAFYNANQWMAKCEQEHMREQQLRLMETAALVAPL